MIRDFEKYCFFDIADFLGEAPFFYDHSGNPLWFEGGSFLNGVSEFHLLKAIVENGGIPAGAGEIATEGMNFYRVARDRQKPEYGIAMRQRELQDIGAYWAPFEGDDMHLRISPANRAQSSVRRFGYMGELEEVGGVEIFNEYEEGSDFDGVIFAVGSQAEAEQIGNVIANKYNKSQTHLVSALQEGGRWLCAVQRRI